MQKLLFILLAVLSGLITTAQNTVIHDPHAQVRTVGDFHAIRVSTGIHLYFTQSAEKAVAVSASSAEYRSRIRTEVSNGVLNIYYDNDWGWSWRDLSGKELTAYVSASSLDELKASSGAHVEVEGTLKSANLALGFSSGAHFTGKVEAGNLRMDQSSGAHATVSGTASLLKAEASSGGALHGYDLQADRCDINASSGGHVYITVQKEMSVSASSGGHIEYNGPGVLTDVHTSSGGKVSRR
jgi:hypothetical protein